jgi:group I intron endonuclease
MINITETINKGVIYKLESPSGKIYIGQSINFLNRVKKYKKQAKNSIGKHLFNAIEKYGFDKFNITILATIELDNNVGITKSKLDKLEIYYIQKFDSFNNGYNLTAGGNGSFKRIISEETKAKLSKANKGKEKVKSILLHCSICNNKFYLKPFQIKSRLRRSRDITDICCSRECGYFKLKN